MITQWFKKAGWVYVPISIIGSFLTVCTLIFCITVFIAIDKNAHSATDTLYGVFPYFVSAFTILFWVASNSSGNTEVQD